LVAVSPVDEDALRKEVREHAGGETAEVHIVAPAPHTSRLQRLTGAVDEARAEAEGVAREAAEAVKGTASVETEVGDPNPLQAIEDALRSFPADELIIVTRHPARKLTGSKKTGRRRLSSGSGCRSPTSPSTDPRRAGSPQSAVASGHADEPPEAQRCPCHLQPRGWNAHLQGCVPESRPHRGKPKCPFPASQ